jgi:hypothetical protein
LHGKFGLASDNLLSVDVPGAEMFPPELHGQRMAQVVVVFSGDLDRGEGVIKPLRDLGPAGELVQPMPYVAAQAMGEEMYPAHKQVYFKSGCIYELDGAAQTIVEAASSPNLLWGLLEMGGAIAHQADDATAFSHRRGRYNYVALGMWDDPAINDEQIDVIRENWRAVEPHTRGAYVNFLTPDETQDLHDAYANPQERRLAETKKVYDPDNFFRANINIEPA